jgi:hypothetical protein
VLAWHIVEGKRQRAEKSRWRRRRKRARAAHGATQPSDDAIPAPGRQLH